MEIIQKIRVIDGAREEWIIGGVPLSIISAFLRPFLILAILYFAYQVGQVDYVIKDCNYKIAAANREIMALQHPTGNTLNLTQYGNFTNITNP
jgi:hypothetical protein